MDVLEFFKYNKLNILNDVELTALEWNELIKEAYRIGIQEENIIAYFVCCNSCKNSRISNEIRAQLHNTAAMILTMGMNYINGAYELGFYHMTQAIDLSPENVQYKEYALATYNDSPEFNMDDNYRVALVKQLLNIEPYNKIGLRFAGDNGDVH